MEIYRKFATESASCFFSCVINHILRQLPSENPHFNITKHDMPWLSQMNRFLRNNKQFLCTISALNLFMILSMQTVCHFPLQEAPGKLPE